MQNLPSGLWLIAALAWACMALGGFYLASQLPQWEYGYWVGSVASVLVLYNLLRWWIYRGKTNRSLPFRPTPTRPVLRREEDFQDPEGKDRFPPLT